MKFSVSRRLVPSLSALVAFEAAARLGSFTRAAEELNLTQGAISRNVKLLEDQLQLPLFERVRQRITLTDVGVFYAGEIRQTLDRLASTTAQAMSLRTAGGMLRLGMIPTFGTKWLIPRLPDFFSKNRGVTINFSSHVRKVDFGRDLVDAAIHFGEPRWPGVILHRIIGEDILPVASPEFLERENIREPADFCRVTLLVQSTRTEAWSAWFAHAGVEAAEHPSILVFEHFAMVVQAAVAGLGAALVPKVLVLDEIASGELVALSDQSIVDSKGYFLAYPRERANYPPLVAFKDWLVDQINADLGTPNQYE